MTTQQQNLFLNLNGSQTAPMAGNQQPMVGQNVIFPSNGQIIGQPQMIQVSPQNVHAGQQGLQQGQPMVGQNMIFASHGQIVGQQVSPQMNQQNVIFASHGQIVGQQVSPQMAHISPQNVNAGQPQQQGQPMAGQMMGQQGQMGQMNPNNDINPPSHERVCQLIASVKDKERTLMELDRQCRQNEEVLNALKKESEETQGWNPYLVPEIVTKLKTNESYKIQLTQFNRCLPPGMTIDDIYNQLQPQIQQQQSQTPQQQPPQQQSQTPQQGQPPHTPNQQFQPPQPQGQPSQQQFQPPQPQGQPPHTPSQQFQPPQQPPQPQPDNVNLSPEEEPFVPQVYERQVYEQQTKDATRVNQPLGDSFRSSDETSPTNTSQPKKEYDENTPIQVIVKSFQMPQQPQETTGQPSGKPTIQVPPIIVNNPLEQKEVKIEPIIINVGQPQVNVSNGQGEVSSMQQVAQPTEISVNDIHRGFQPTQPPNGQITSNQTELPPKLHFEFSEL